MQLAFSDSYALRLDYIGICLVASSHAWQLRARWKQIGADMIIAIIEEYRGYAEPKVRDCDVKYITSYEVSSLQNLFTRPTTSSSSITDRDRKILKYFVLAAIVLTIWIGSLCWASHRGLAT